MSLMMYIPLPAIQKAKNAAKVTAKTSGLNNVPLNMGAANTRKFFVHCLTLISERNSITVFIIMRTPPVFIEWDS